MRNVLAQRQITYNEALKRERKERVPLAWHYEQKVDEIRVNNIE
ncbi:hypothetical protein [Hahella sp. NBU794]